MWSWRGQLPRQAPQCVSRVRSVLARHPRAVLASTGAVHTASYPARVPSLPTSAPAPAPALPPLPPPHRVFTCCPLIPLLISCSPMFNPCNPPDLGINVPAILLFLATPSPLRMILNVNSSPRPAMHARSSTPLWQVAHAAVILTQGSKAIPFLAGCSSARSGSSTAAAAVSSAAPDDQRLVLILGQGMEFDMAKPGLSQTATLQDVRRLQQGLAGRFMADSSDDEGGEDDEEEEDGEEEEEGGQGLGVKPGPQMDLDLMCSLVRGRGEAEGGAAERREGRGRGGWGERGEEGGERRERRERREEGVCVC